MPTAKTRPATPWPEITCIDDFRDRAQRAGRQAAQVLQLTDLPFGGIDPCNVMAEFNVLLAAADRLMGHDQVADFHAYDGAVGAQARGSSPHLRCFVLRQAAQALQRLASHLEAQIGAAASAVVSAK